MTNIKPKAIIFDWDDTLANTRQAVVLSMNYVLNKYKLENWEISKYKYRDTSKSLKENFVNFFKDNAKQAYIDYLSFYQKEALNMITPMPYAKELLHFFNIKDIKLYIISNKEKVLLLNEINKCFSSIKFENIFANGDSLHNKPFPDPVFDILKNRNYTITPQTVWLVGDTKQDTECAFASNCKAILIGSGKFMNDTYIKKNLENKKLSIYNDLYEFFQHINWN